ncbi:MAG: hypothetical protein MUE31_03715 [Candidatus Nanopelagicales bacterium]|jgi:hypothetical protein|nr:hypothetical protein [Candidatus Nanopelagicales bacterium]
MGRSIQVKDRTTCSCTGFALAAFEVRVTDGVTVREYRIREWAYHGVWQLQELKPGTTGTTDDDYTDLGQFPTKDAALAHIQALAVPEP